MTQASQASASFPLGRICATANAHHLLSPVELLDGLRRHAAGDWGNLDPQDAKRNDWALRNGGRLFSAYGKGVCRFWIITEPDRSATTVLLPQDY